MKCGRIAASLTIFATSFFVSLPMPWLRDRGVSPSRSIQKPEEPERDLAPDADLHVVVDDKALRHVLDLLEALALAADLEGKSSVAVRGTPQMPSIQR